MSERLALRALAAAGLLATASGAAAEPVFLSRQYPRCTNCHVSPTGGGLLTPYGRSLSREELSTFGRRSGAASPGREHEPLFGLLGGALGPLSVGIDLRPSRLRIDTPTGSATRSLLMNADVTAALQRGAWTFLAELGRQPQGDDAHVASFEHWVSYRAPGGLGLRAGRFLPAYGVKLADHTAFTRAILGLDNDGQVYALEASYSGARHLLQLTAGPGYADSSAEGRRSLTATGRWQVDLRPRTVLVLSGLYRDASDRDPRSAAAGLALGFAPSSRLTLWGQADLRFRGGESDDGRAWTLLGQAALEVHRGVWIALSPQLATDFEDVQAGVLRLNASLNLLPRTHWHVVVSWSHDRDRRTERSTKVLLAQLHLYL